MLPLVAGIKQRVTGYIVIQMATAAVVLESVCCLVLAMHGVLRGPILLPLLLL